MDLSRRRPHPCSGVQTLETVPSHGDEEACVNTGQPTRHEVHGCRDNVSAYVVADSFIARSRASTSAGLGVFQSVMAAYVSRLQRYGRSTIRPGRGAMAARESMS